MMKQLCLSKLTRWQSRATATTPQTVDTAQQLGFAAQIALGMDALYKQRIVHRDLAAYVRPGAVAFLMALQPECPFD